MAYCIKDPETERLARTLAQAIDTTMVEAIRRACAHELAALERTRRPPLADRLAPLLDELASRRRLEDPEA